MRASASLRTAMVLVLATAVAWPAIAQWSPDPGTNTPVAVRSGEKNVVKAAAIPGGGVYVGWFEPGPNGSQLRLQRLNRGGVPTWEQEGLLVSDHPSMSWLTDWDLIATTSGDAALAFSDIRSGNLDVVAYRISPSGQMLWGQDGVAASDGPDFDGTPRIAEATDGDLVVAWTTILEVGGTQIRMQRIAADGALRFPLEGIVVAAAPDKSPSLAGEPVPAPGGRVTLSWVGDVVFSGGPEGSGPLLAQQFGADGLPQWRESPTVVFDGIRLSVVTNPALVSDGVGGAVIAWKHFSGNRGFNVSVQYLDASGRPVFAGEGVPVSTLATQARLYPWASYDETTGQTVVAWGECNLGQTSWGVSAQKLSAAGERLWGNEGRVLQPLEAARESYSVCGTRVGGGAVVAWTDTEHAGSSRVRVTRIDPQGHPVWSPAIVDASTAVSGKGKTWIALDPGGAVVLVWTDDRGSAPGIYAQRVALDGRLGGGCPQVSRGLRRPH